jgi:uncharacterized RDD family membrane protein YckC
VTSQPGWHPDPVPPQPGHAPQLRWWDGTRWTEHTAPAAPEAPTQPAPYAGTYGASPYPAVYTQGPPTTPDGERLAGWWQRVGATVLDGIVLGIIGTLVALPWWREIVTTYTDWLHDAIDSANTGATVDTTGLQEDIARPLFFIGAINLGLTLVYNVAFLTWRQATPGKMVMGLKVRLRERPELPFGTVLLRWVGQYGPSALGLIPLVGGIFGLYSLIDYLWPLWDGNKQAIHDKIAKTNVVRTR